MVDWTYKLTTSPSWSPPKMRTKQVKKCINLPIRRNKTGEEIWWMRDDNGFCKACWSRAEEAAIEVPTEGTLGDTNDDRVWDEAGDWKQSRFKANNMHPPPVFSPSCNSQATAPPSLLLIGHKRFFPGKHDLDRLQMWGHQIQQRESVRCGAKRRGNWMRAAVLTGRVPGLLLLPFAQNGGSQEQRYWQMGKEMSWKRKQGPLSD